MKPSTNPGRILRILSASTQPTPRAQALPIAIFNATRTHLSPRQSFFCPPRSLSTTPSRKMASDDDYMAFLNKANQDTGAASTQQSGTVKTKTVDQGSEIPREIKNVCKDAVYVSEADEPFEEVALKHTGGLPDEKTFATLINLPNASDADISILDPLDWDSRGQYTEVIEAVRQASQGNDVRVYRVVRDRTRVEYWVITAADGRILGVKALAVES